MATTNGPPPKQALQLQAHLGRQSLSRPAVRSSRIYLTWMLLVGIFLPYLEFTAGGLVFTIARFTVTLLVIPAGITLMRPERKWIASDFFAIATAAWMLVAASVNGGFQAYVGAEALEFAGGYLIGRAFFTDQPTIALFIRVFKVIASIVIVLGFFDTLAGYAVTLQFFGLPLYQSDVRNGLFRADSVFYGGELFGTFCVAATALFFYSERSLLKRAWYSGLGILGTAASVSSGPLLTLGIGLVMFSYDRILQKTRWRWKLLGAAILAFTLVSYAVLNDPITAIVGHFTFNSETGNFRLATWTLGLDQVAVHPIVGRGFTSYASESPNVQLFVGKSVDALWLLLMIRYGVPEVILLILTISLPFLRPSRFSTSDPYLSNVRVGFSFAVVLMCLIGLTVHFWDSIWIFFSLCIGIRASFSELETRSRSSMRSRRHSKSGLVKQEQVINPSTT